MVSEKQVAIQAFKLLSQYDDYWSQSNANHKVAAAFIHCATLPGIGKNAVRLMCWAARDFFKKAPDISRKDVIALLELIPDPNPVPDLNRCVYD